MINVDFCIFSLGFADCRNWAVQKPQQADPHATTDAHEKLSGENNSQNGILDKKIHMRTHMNTYTQVYISIYMFISVRKK